MRILLLGAGAEPFLKRGDPPRVDTGSARPPEGRGLSEFPGQCRESPRSRTCPWKGASRWGTPLVELKHGSV